MPFSSIKARMAFFANKNKKTKEGQLPGLEAKLPELTKAKLPNISTSELVGDSKELDEYVKPLINPLDKFKKLKGLLKPRF